ncbi:MAG: glycosyltransferase [Salinivirgaceae bacterium]
MTKSTNKVLIITYYWPPASGPGVQRFLKFCKYLPVFGWKPYVVTVENGTYSSTDATLAQDIPASASVVKTKTSEPFTIYNRLTGTKKNSGTVGMINMDSKQSLLKQASVYVRANFFVPDARKGWNKHAVAAAKELIRKENIENIITTGPPQSTHLIGLKLKQDLGVNWIADFRDPWTTVYYNDMLPRTNATKVRDKKLEDKVLAAADKVVVVSDGLKDEFADRNNDISVIYNGFDEHDMAYMPWEDKNKKCIIASIGNFKPNQNINTLWQALAELKEENEEFAHSVKISLTGNIDNSVLNSFKKFGIESMLEINDYVPHMEATKRMMIADLLLFIVPQTPRNHLIITGKLFEYIASRTPIFSVGPIAGNAAQILEKAQRARMIEYDDKSELKKALREYFNKWQSADKPIKHPESGLWEFSRKGLTEKLADQLNELTAQKKSDKK